jgi:hypothetical protein
VVGHVTAVALEIVAHYVLVLQVVKRQVLSHLVLQDLLSHAVSVTALVVVVLDLVAYQYLAERNCFVFLLTRCPLVRQIKNFDLGEVYVQVDTLLHRLVPQHLEPDDLGLGLPRIQINRELVVVNSFLLQILIGSDVDEVEQVHELLQRHYELVGRPLQQLSGQFSLAGETTSVPSVPHQTKHLDEDVTVLLMIACNLVGSAVRHQSIVTHPSVLLGLGHVKVLLVTGGTEPVNDRLETLETRVENGPVGKSKRPQE